MKKILLLGGSAQQLVAIKAAKELGYYTMSAIIFRTIPDNMRQINFTLQAQQILKPFMKSLRKSKSMAYSLMLPTLLLFLLLS